MYLDKWRFIGYIVKLNMFIKLYVNLVCVIYKCNILKE